ncbi:DUF3102 domain-containing protein [Paenibacillaceae bacterium]|nr:DUF3102 domain-containing protein [Paenibacillaceae bacterium]
MTKVKKAAAIVPVYETTVSNRTPDVIASEIRFIDSQARQYVLQSAIEIGNKLTEAKALVSHGEWGTWLKEHVNYSQSSANNFMKVASEYQNSQALANLSYSQAVALLSLPAEERETFVEENNAAEMSSRELAAAVKENQELAKQLAEEQKQQADQKAQFDAWAAQQAMEQKELQARYDLAQELRHQTDQQLTDLQSELDKAKAGGDDKAASKARAELRKVEKAKQAQETKVAELQEALKAQQAEAEKAAVEMVQKRVQELQEEVRERESALQAQLDKATQQLQRSNNESFLRGKVYLQQIVSNGDGVVKAIAEINDKAEQDKLTQATVTLLTKLLDQLQPSQKEKAK